MWLFFHSPTPGFKIFFLDRGGQPQNLRRKIEKNKAGQEVNQAKNVAPTFFYSSEKKCKNNIIIKFKL